MELTKAELTPAVSAVITAVLQRSNKTSKRFFDSPRLGNVYRTFVISQILDRAAGAVPDAPPRSRAAEVFSEYGLTGPGSEDWTQLYEHVGGVVAAAVTIATRMNLTKEQVEEVRAAALMHDATKRRDVERHGALANSAANADRSLAVAMHRLGYSTATVTAAMNTGRDDRVFASGQERLADIEQKGVLAAIVGLADARSCGPHLASLDEAQSSYLARKTDAESREFFTRHWKPYYQAVETYLTRTSANLDLSMSDADVYTETVFPEVFGPRPSSLVRRRFGFQPSGAPAVHPPAGPG